MLPLNLAITPLTKIAVAVGVLVATNIFTASWVHKNESTKCQNLLLKQEVAVRVIERKVEVLDKATLERKIASERARWEKEQQERKVVNEIIADHKDNPSNWCELNANELLVWNCENADFLDNSCKELGNRGKLPGEAASSNGGSIGKSVGKQE